MLLLVFLTVFSRGSLNRFLSEEDMDAAPMGVPRTLGRRNLGANEYTKVTNHHGCQSGLSDGGSYGKPTFNGIEAKSDRAQCEWIQLLNAYGNGCNHDLALACPTGANFDVQHIQCSGACVEACEEVSKIACDQDADCVGFGMHGRYGVGMYNKKALACSDNQYGLTASGGWTTYIKEDWPKCAAQWETCICNGIVKYGEGSNWAEKAATGSISCTNAEFGDPSIGQAKDCFCSGCMFRAVEASECPANANLKRCYARDMNSGEMCESDSGDTVNQQNLNNCNPGGWDIFKYECFGVPAVIEPDDIGDCDVNTVSTWNGNIEATYTSCSGIPAAATFIVKVSEITGIKNCPLFKDWVFTVGCPNGVCPLDVGFDISLDVCDLMMAIATGGASFAAKTAAKELGKQVGKQMSKEWQRKMAQNMADNIGAEAKKNIRDSEVGKGLCADIEKSIGVNLQCLLQAEASVTIPGLQEVLAILNGGVSLKLNVGMEYVIGSNSIRNVALDMGFGYAIPELAPAGWAITILAKTIDEIPSMHCNKNDPRKIAKEMTTGLSITQSGVSGQMQITCGDSQLFQTLEEIGEKLVEGAEEVGRALNNASGEVRENLQRAQEHVEDLCEHVTSQINECRDVTERVCNWVKGRRQLKGEGSDDRRMLFGTPFGWVCDNVVSQVCNVVDVLHC